MGVAHPAMGTSTSMTADRPESASYLDSENEGSDYQNEDESQVDSSDTKIVKARFAILKDQGSEVSGDLDCRVFDKEPYTTDPFCRQLITKQIRPFPPSSKGKQTESHNDKVSLKSFSRTITNWQDGSIDNKIELIFSLLKSHSHSGTISHEILWRVLLHAIPPHTEAECQLLAKAMIDIMTKTDSAISFEKFKSWIHQNIDEDKLIEASDFRITNLDVEYTTTDSND